LRFINWINGGLGEEEEKKEEGEKKPPEGYVPHAALTEARGQNKALQDEVDKILRIAATFRAQEPR